MARPKKNGNPDLLPAAPVPQTVIQNCTFHGSDSAGVLALAKALEANARAIEALCSSVGHAQPLLMFMDGKKVD